MKSSAIITLLLWLPLGSHLHAQGFIPPSSALLKSDKGRKYGSAEEARRKILDVFESGQGIYMLAFDGLESSKPLRIDDERILIFFRESLQSASFELSEKGLPRDSIMSFVFFRADGLPATDVYLQYSRARGAMTLADLVVEDGVVKSGGTYQFVGGSYTETEHGFTIKENILSLSAHDREMFALCCRGIADLTRQVDLQSQP